jgi:hypothetical protein
MKCYRTLPIAFALLAAILFSAPCGAQTSADSSYASYQAAPVPSDSSSASYKTRLVPTTEIVAPFSLDASLSASANPIEFRSESQMTEMDSNLAKSTEPSIREGATMAGIEFDKGKWSYEELVCQALPGHVFLLFHENNGEGDRSLFSAAIPRSGKGRVRIIPILRRGYSLFSPAPVNVLAIAAFNRIRADETASKTADWLSTAWCYAALTGSHPEMSSLPTKSADANLALSFPPTLEVQSDGGAIVRFVDVAAARQPMQWALTFNSKGKLLKVARSAMPLYDVKLIPSMPDQQPSTQGSK